MPRSESPSLSDSSSTKMFDLRARLQALASTIDEKSPHCSGTVAVRDTDLILFYGKNESAHRFDFSLGTPDEQLQQLAKECDPASFGLKQEAVLDDKYRKAGKLDLSAFATHFDPGRAGILNALLEVLVDDSKQRGIRAELYKLNVYGPGGFFKPHVDTPRGETMLGSLVVILPTRHEGGALVVRQDSQEWQFDATRMLAENAGHSVAYVAFYGDVEHEVLPVTSGYRVTLTYNLYFTSPQEDAAHLPLQTVHDVEQSAFQAELQRLLADEQFLPEGGFLMFGLKRKYAPGKDGVAGLRGSLKSPDSALARACDAMGLRNDLKVHIRDASDVLCDYVPDFSGRPMNADLGWWIREYDNGKVVRREDKYIALDYRVYWVTRPVRSNEMENPYMAYGNEPSVAHAYIDVCLLVGIGPAGARMQTAELYTTVAVPKGSADWTDYGYY